MQIRTALTTALATTGLVGTGLLVGNRVNMLPIEASSNAATYDSLFKVLFSIGTMLFLGITIVLVYSLVRFRRTAGDTSDGVAIEGNLPLEIVWTAIPAVVILFVGIYSYDIYERMGGMAPLMDHAAMDHSAMDHSTMDRAALVSDSPVPDPERISGGIGAAARPDTSGRVSPTLPVEVTAMQFAFIFHYPQGDITSEVTPSATSSTWRAGTLQPCANIVRSAGTRRSKGSACAVAAASMTRISGRWPGGCWFRCARCP